MLSRVAERRSDAGYFPRTRLLDFLNTDTYTRPQGGCGSRLRSVSRFQVEPGASFFAFVPEFSERVT